MQKDIWRFSLLVIGAGVIGFMTGHALLVMLITSLCIIGWQAHKLDALYRWTVNAKDNPMPESTGQTYLLHREISRRRTKNQNRKRQLSLLLNQFRQAISVLPDAIVLIDNDGKIEWANQTINFKCVRYTDNLRMIIARDVSRLIKVNQMHSDFVANVSHELKTPLTVLRGYLEIMENNDELPKKFVKPLEQMSLQSVRMQLIVSDLLYLAKLENTNSVVKHELIDVTHIVNTIVETIQPLIEEKHHKLELDIDYSVQITGAQTELHSAFSNLISNAIKYTPENGLIRVHWSHDNNKATFTVRDNGLGIAPQHIDRLTQRFYRVDTDRSRESGGTGLGLAIVKHVLQRHNAELEVSSKEGKGSEFKCIFTLNQTEIKNTSSLADS